MNHLHQFHEILGWISGTSVRVTLKSYPACFNISLKHIPLKDRHDRNLLRKLRAPITFPLSFLSKVLNVRSEDYVAYMIDQTYFSVKNACRTPHFGVT